MVPPIPPPPGKFPARARQSAFSLVEVVLAVGIISFAFVAILGLIPAGLTQFRQAMDNSVGAQIAQRIIFECQQTDYDTLANVKALRYFDEQGNEVLTAGDQSIVYWVNTRVTTTTQLAESPGAGVDSAGAPAGSSSSVATVVVQVAFNPGGQALTLSNGLIDVTVPQFRGTKTYCAQIGRND